MLHPRTLQALGGILLLTQVAAGWAWPQNQPRSPEQILRRAFELEQTGDLEGAIQQYQAFLALHPHIPEIRLNLAAAYVSVGNYPEAIAEYERALELGDLSDPGAVRFRLAGTYFQASKLEQARDLLVALVAEQPEHNEAVRLLASCYLRLNDRKKVIELLSPLESELGQDPDLAFLLGTALLQDGQFEQGDRLVEIAMQGRDSAEARLMLGEARMMSRDYFGAEKELERALELNPKLPSLNATYGKLLRIMTKHDEANEAFSRELEINPHDFDSHLFHGVYLYDYEQIYEEALASFERALEARPGDPAARFQMGLVYSSLNRTEEALQTLKGVVDEYPGFLEGHVALTRLYYRLGEEEEAERHRVLAEGLRTNRDGQQLIGKGHFSQAVELFDQQKKVDPSDPQPYFYSGMALGQMGDWTAAAAQLAEAVRLDPENPRYTIAYANALARSGQNEPAMAALGSFDQERVKELEPALLWLLSETYLRTGSHDQALLVLDVLAGKNAGEARVNLLRGQVYLVKGDYERARGLVEKSIESEPAENALAYSILGMALYQLGDKEGSKEAFLKAVDQDPDNVEYLGRLGAVCLELGESRLAIKYLQRASSAAEDSPAIAQLLERAHEAEKNQVARETAALQQQETTGPTADPSTRSQKFCWGFWQFKFTA